MFKTVVLELWLTPQSTHISHITRGQSDGMLLDVPHFASKKHFGLSFAYGAPRIWNDLSDDARCAKSLSTSRKKLKPYLFCKAYPLVLVLFIDTEIFIDPC